MDAVQEGVSCLMKWINANKNNDYSNDKIVIDYIAGMTDDFFIEQFMKISSNIPRKYGYKL